MNVIIEESRKKVLNDEFSKPYFPKIKVLLKNEIDSVYVIHPK
jgi:uracil DNA glycosylase